MADEPETTLPWLEKEDAATLRNLGRVGGWAPGDYMGKCRDCEIQFTGDKRAWQCLPCAIKAQSAYADRLQAENAEAREIIGAFYTQVSIEGQRHFPHALTTRARAFINREAKSNG